MNKLGNWLMTACYTPHNNVHSTNICSFTTILPVTMTAGLVFDHAHIVHKHENFTLRLKSRLKSLF